MKGTKRPKDLRQQVAREQKRRAVVFFIVVAAAIVYLGITIAIGDKGFMKYIELQDSRNELQAEYTRLDTENKALKQEVEALKKDSYVIEKHAREDYGMAKPNEYIFQFKEDGR